MAEFAVHAFIGNRFQARINYYELLQCPRLIHGHLNRGIWQIEPVLDEMDSKHAPDTDQPENCALRLEAEKLYGLGQFLSGNDRFDFVQKLFLAGLLVNLLETCIRKLILAHALLLALEMGAII